MTTSPSHHQQSILCLMGPTAVGKTDLACAIAQSLPIEIISVDSALIYRDMNIGTAKPSLELRLQTPHALIDICQPTEPYSVGQFLNDAHDEIERIVSNGNTPLLVGGTMMYFNQLQKGCAQLPSSNQTVRETIEKQAQADGWNALHQQLSIIDPQIARRIHPNDKQRIGRALEIHILTGALPSEVLIENHMPAKANYHFINIALIPENRQWLHHRIEQRFIHMLHHGFLEEIKQLKDKYGINIDYPAMRMVGYRQFWPYLEGTETLEHCTQKAIAATRQLAKRQLTWLRRWPGLTQLKAEDQTIETWVTQIAQLLIPPHRASSN